MTPDEYVLNQLMQECNEVAHRVSKLLHFGADEIEPGKSRTNGERVLDEMVDLLAVWVMVLDAGLVDDHGSEEEFEAACHAKRAKVLKFLAYSQRLGLTSPGELATGMCPQHRPAPAKPS